MEILEIYDDAGVMTAKFRVDKKRTGLFYWQGIPLALIAFCLLQVV